MSVMWLLFGPFVLLFVMAVVLVKTSNKATYWRDVARGEINDPAAHAVCNQQFAELQSKLTALNTRFGRTLKEKEKLERVFEEKVKPVVNEAAVSLAAWIAEEEAELANRKDK